MGHYTYYKLSRSKGGGVSARTCQRFLMDGYKGADLYTEGVRLYVLVNHYWVGVGVGGGGSARSAPYIPCTAADGRFSRSHSSYRVSRTVCSCIRFSEEEGRPRTDGDTVYGYGLGCSQETDLRTKWVILLRIQLIFTSILKLPSWYAQAIKWLRVCYLCQSFRTITCYIYHWLF